MTNEQLTQLMLNMGDKFNTLISVMTDNAKQSNCKYTLYSWLDEWYNIYKKPYLKPTGLYQVRNCIDTHIKNNLADVPLQQLQAIDVQKAIQKIQSSRMRKYTFDTINAALKQAYKLDLLADNISVKLDSVTHTRKKGLSLTAKQEQTFVTLIHGNRLENLFLFYLVSGCRKSEALALKWSDIDYNKNTLFIDGTKTICSKRYIPLFDDIKLILERQPKCSKYVFDVPIYVVDNVWRYFKAKNKLPYCIHSLRHTFSTRHYENKVPPKVIQKWMGHAKVETTQDIYTDVQNDFEITEFVKANNCRKLVQKTHLPSCGKKGKRVTD